MNLSTTSGLVALMQSNYSDPRPRAARKALMNEVAGATARSSTVPEATTFPDSRITIRCPRAVASLGS